METQDNDFRLHKLLVVTWASSQEKYLVERKGKFARKGEEGPLRLKQSQVNKGFVCMCWKGHS